MQKGSNNSSTEVGFILSIGVFPGAFDKVINVFYIS
jgi:hypothetical protein